MATPPWVWILIAVLVLLIGAWFTNIACPTFGKSCSDKAGGAGSSGPVTADQIKVIETFF
jgi:hypothetical protein